MYAPCFRYGSGTLRRGDMGKQCRRHPCELAAESLKNETVRYPRWRLGCTRANPDQQAAPLKDETLRDPLFA